MPKTFDSDFYVVCATVIPVLFLAVAVQGGSYKALLDVTLKVRITNADDSWRRKLGARIRARILQQISYFIWCAGALGEVLALQILYLGHEQSGSRIAVFVCTVLLVLAVAMSPLNSYLDVRKKLDKWQDSPTGPEQSGNASQDAVVNDGTRGESITDGPPADEESHPALKVSGLGWPDKESRPHT
jgi:hypothetical protein